MSLFERWKGSAKEHFVVTHFDAYQDDVLAQTETAVYEQHLKTCRECREWAQRQETLGARLGMEMAPTAVLATASAARIQQNLYSSMRRAVIMNNVRTSVAAVGALAVLALIVGAVAWWQSSGFGSSVQAPAIGQQPALTLSGHDTLDEQVIQAIGEGDVGGLAAALEEGTDPDAQSSPGRPALFLATKRGNADAAKLLIDHGADVHTDTVDGAILVVAAVEGHQEIVEMLLDAGADISVTGSAWAENDPALYAAVIGMHRQIARLLVERGADVNQTGTDGAAALQIAAATNQTEAVRLLLENGADIDHQSDDGTTALHAAAFNRFSGNSSLEAAQILIELGAALNIKDAEGRTALDVALPDVAELLREAGAEGAAQGLSTLQGPTFIVPGGGRLVRVVGNGTSGYSGDGDQAIEASLNLPSGLTWDTEGNMYIGQDFRISKVDATTGIITTVAGTGLPGNSGDGGPATEAQIGRVQELAFDADGNLYFPEYQSNSIRRVDTDGVITTVAGVGFGFSPDGTPATEARFDDPFGLAFDSNGTLYFSDGGNQRVRIIDDDGTLTTVAGTGELGESGDGGPATMAKLGGPRGLTFDAQDNLYIGTSAGTSIRKVDANGIISSVPGAEPGYVVKPDAEGGLIIADWRVRIFRWTPDGASTLLLESGDFDLEGAGPDDEQSAVRIETASVAVDGAGNIYVTDDHASHSVYRFEP